MRQPKYETTIFATPPISSTSVHTTTYHTLYLQRTLQTYLLSNHLIDPSQVSTTINQSVPCGAAPLMHTRGQAANTINSPMQVLYKQHTPSKKILPIKCPSSECFSFAYFRHTSSPMYKEGKKARGDLPAWECPVKGEWLRASSFCCCTRYSSEASKGELLILVPPQPTSQSQHTSSPSQSHSLPSRQKNCDLHQPRKRTRSSSERS